MSEDLAYKNYKEAYRKLASFEASRELEGKISSILFHTYQLNEPVPDIGSYRKTPFSQLDKIIKNYNKKLNERLHSGQAKFGVHTAEEMKWYKMMSELGEEGIDTENF